MRFASSTLRRTRSPRGFTLLEILITIGIIVFLFTLIATIATKVREKARASRTKSTIKRIHVALDAYRAYWKEYPSGAPNFPDTWPSPYVTTGVQLDKTLVYRGIGVEEFTSDEFDKATGNIFIDGWGNPIYYRKVGPTQMLIWSYGPNGKDEIGTGQIWDPKAQAYTGGNGGGMLERMGDDISQNEVDY